MAADFAPPGGGSRERRMPSMSEATSVPQEVAEALAKATTGIVNDALALLGVNGGIRGVRPSRGSEEARIVAPASTVLFGSPRPDGRKLNMYQIIRDSPAGSVLVIDGEGIDAHFTGDNQGECARRQGVVGVVVYGGARDVARYRAMGMPLYCTGSATIDEPAEIQIIGYNVPVEIGGVTVRPGDVIVAGQDGVVCIPAEALTAILEKMRIIFEVEQEMERAIRGEAPIDEIKRIIARKKPKRSPRVRAPPHRSCAGPQEHRPIEPGWAMAQAAMPSNGPRARRHQAMMLSCRVRHTTP